MSLNKWTKTPKGYVTLVMAAFLIIASIGSHQLLGIAHGIVAVGVALGFDYLYCILKGRKRIKLDGAIITGLIISLILSITTTWQVIIFTTILAILSKHLLVYKKKPIFNPAAFGLLLSILLFNSEQSWWGAFGDLPYWYVAFLLVGGYMVVNRVHKFPKVFSFLGASLIILFIMGLFQMGIAFDGFRSPFINATLFFGFFMITDPPTSPAKDKDQVVFGLLVAVISVVIYWLQGGLMYLYIGLMAGNLFHVVKGQLFPKAKVIRSKTIKG